MMQRLIKMDTHELSTTQRLSFGTPRTSRLRKSSSFRVSPKPSASPVERQRKNTSGVKASRVGAKKRHSSSGCAVSSKILPEERKFGCEDPLPEGRDFGSAKRAMTMAMRSTRMVDVNMTSLK